VSISELSIRRPVLATVMSLAIVLIGLMSYLRLGVREYPKIDEPVITVETTYRGAGAEIIESQVTQPLEDSLSSIEGIDYVSSISRSEKSQITIRFKLTREVDGAANDVRDRVARARGRLPDEVDEPIISKVEADAQPIMYLAFSSDRHTALEITDFADRYVKDRLQNVGGVADVRIFGERRYAMRIWLNAARLAAYRLTPQDVEDALRRQNVEIPAGRIESNQREFTVVSETGLQTPEQFENIVLREVDGYLVRLGAVARAELGAQDVRVRARFMGGSAVAIGIVKQSTANPLDVSKAVQIALPSIIAALPQGMKVDVAYDTSLFIARSIDNVFHTIGEAIVLVVLVIFFFLRSVRATLIPLVTIPVSLIGAFALMLLFGFSINTLTLLSLVLAIGLVVDDAIVMLENIYRHVEAGMRPFEAAIKGAREIGFAVIAMTLTLAAVYAPVAFQSGRTGRLFIEFALTLAGAVIVSGFVALTLSPMMCSKLLKGGQHGKFYVATENIFTALTNGYRRLLVTSLRLRPAVVGFGLIVAAGGVLLFVNLKEELTPTEDRGAVVTFAIAPEGSTVDFTDKYARRLEGFVASTPEVNRYFMVVGFPVVNNAIGFSLLKPWESRERSSATIAGGLMPMMFGVPGVLAFPVLPPSLGRSPIEKPIEFVVMTSRPYAELESYVQKLLAEVRTFPGIVNVDTDLKLNKPELRVNVDREKAADIGIGVEALGRSVETLLGGRQVTRFKRDGKQYDVIVQVAEGERRNPDDLHTIYARGRGDVMVPLSNLVQVEETVSPRELNHFNKLRSATISATLGPGYSQGDALKFLEAAAKRALPATAITDTAGQLREFKESSGTIWVTFALALAFIYLVLAAQFESFVGPFIIMLTVPLAVTGALLALKLTGGTFNIYSQVGLVTLVGLITKHGILIVEFANQLRERGATVTDAVVESASLRLRPILMTTGAMVLGAVPLALATGAGAEGRQQIGWVIVGGLLLGTVLTLFVVPTAYTLVVRKRRTSPDAAPQLAPAE
jgi:multidrug efflux pump